MGMSFEHAPLRVYWEVTRACGLACRHCRAEASPRADPAELSPLEGRKLLESLTTFGDPVPQVIFTGGDPLEREDLFDLIAYARSLGLVVSVSPSATPRLTAGTMKRFKQAGVAAVSLSIDGSTAERHDALRGVPGCFERTLSAARSAAEASLMTQVNTLVCLETVSDLSAIYALATDLRVARWSLFFLVSVGRGAVLQPLDPEAAEHLLWWAADLPKGEGCPIVTTTEAPQFRRIAIERKRLLGAWATRAAFGIRDGNGILFVSHTGDITPSGFVPVAAGNVRTDDIVEVYRNSPMFTTLRRPSEFHGRCGVCRFHSVCGGSRARAWTATGDLFAEDPLCPYVP